MHRSSKTILAFLSLAVPAPAQDVGYGKALDYLGNYPSHSNPGFHDNAQGVSHSDNYWYFTDTDDLYKVPVTHDLDVHVESNPGTLKVDITDAPEMESIGFNHFGDFTYYKHTFPDGVTQQGYLAIGVVKEGDTSVPRSLAIYRAHDLAFLGHCPIPEKGRDGAILVTKAGVVYSQRWDDGAIYNKYSLNWDDFFVSAGTANVNLVHEGTETLRDTNGAPVDLYSVQGMTLNDSEDLLYILNGFMTDPGVCIPLSSNPPYDEAGMMAHGGIRVVDFASWTVLDHSTNGSGLFNYEFYPGAPECEEPEGITWWDLTDGQAPGIEGSLHAMLLDNDHDDPDDEFYLKHYTHRVHVGGGYLGAHATVSAAVGFAWNGCELVIAPGTYAESSILLDKKMMVKAPAGTVVIGG